MAGIDQQLREFVRQSGLTRYQIAKRSGVSQSMLSRFIHGERDITLGTAARIAAALNLRLVTDAKGR